MGLLGDSFDDPQTMATLALAGGLMGGRTFGQGLLGGVQGYQTILGAAQDRTSKKALMEAQAAHYKAEADKDQSIMLQAQRKQAALSNPFMPGTPAGGEVMSPEIGGQTTGSMMQNPTQQAPRQLDWQRLQAQGVSLDEIIKMDSLSRNIGKDKVARTMKGVGQDGKEYEYQVDDYGRKVGDGMAQYRAPISINQGNRNTLADPYTFKPVASFQTFQSPDSAASNAVTMRGQNMTDSRARETTNLAQSKPFEVTGPDGPVLVRQDKQGNITKVEGFGPKTTTEKPLTDVQGAATNFAARMKSASNILDPLEEKGVTTSDFRTMAAGSSLTNFLASPSGRQYQQAEQNWVTANLRKESGAVIGDDEMARERRKYFPIPSDDKQIIAQKQQARKVAEEGMIVQAGPGAKTLASTLEKTSTQAPKSQTAPPQVSQAAINDLKMRGPKADAQFDLIFGPGAAARARGQ